jgi:hypothetical protein
MRVRDIFRKNFPVWPGGLPLVIAPFFTDSPCIARHAFLFFVSWGYLGIAVQLLRGEAYGPHGWNLLWRRSEHPKQYWRTIALLTVLWVLFHLLVVQRVLLPRLQC